VGFGSRSIDCFAACLGFVVEHAAFEVVLAAFGVALAVGVLAVGSTLDIGLAQLQQVDCTLVAFAGNFVVEGTAECFG